MSPNSLDINAFLEIFLEFYPDKKNPCISKSVTFFKWLKESNLIT